jgi:bacteriorhodopsin
MNANPPQILIYCLLDVASKVAFGFVLLLSHEAIDNAAGIQMFAPLEAKGYGTQPPRQSSRAVESYI